MRLVKENINMSRIVCNTAMQIYINEEMVVSEVNQPVESVIKEVAHAVVDAVKVRDDQIQIEGMLTYALLYIGEETGMVQGLQGNIPFEENIRMPGIKEGDEAFVRVTVDSISVKKINSRKILVKAELTVYSTAEEAVNEEAAVDVESEEAVSVLKKKVEALSLVADKKDTFKIKDEITIPSGKSSIYKIVWKDVQIKNITTKLMDRMMHIGGEICVFVMYIPDDDNMPQQWHESTLSFGGTIDIPEVNEEMVSYVNVELQNATLELITNEIGESREIAVDVLLKLSIKAYEEKEMEVLSDVYSPYTNLVPVQSKGVYHKLLVKNSSRSKNVLKLSLEQDKGNVLQICNSGADIKIDSISVADNGLVAEGKIKAYVLYVSSNDSEPVCTASQEVDFTHKMDAEGISKDDEYYINWRVEQVTANMISTEEIEMKAVVIMDAIVFKKCEENVISEIEEEPLDMEVISRMPSVKGHVVQSGETLWNIAKDNYTTIEKIKMINNLKDEQIKKGDRLLIVKSVRK